MVSRTTRQERTKPSGAAKSNKTANVAETGAPAGDVKNATEAKPFRSLPRVVLMDLYTARRYLSLNTHIKTGLRIPVEVYFKDPRVAEVSKKVGIDDEFTTPWEPGLRDGPTSARFAVVDYDATNNALTPPAVWNRRAQLLLRVRR